MGVTKGYEKKLEIVGVGYLAAIQKGRAAAARRLRQRSPQADSRRAEGHLPRSDARRDQGRDKQLVGQFAAEVRAVRKPEPYKGKGVRYEGEHVRRKAGKAVTK